MSHRSRRGYGISSDSESSDSSEAEREFHSPEPPSNEESSQEAAEELTSSTHPFYEGRQYPPRSPIVPPEQVQLPPAPGLSTAPSMSQPAAQAPAPKERGRRPDPFSDQRNYELFRRQLGIFFRANPDIYDTDLQKIFFTLTLLNEGAPGQWAQNYVEGVEAQTVAATGVIPDAAWGTFNAFIEDLKTSFADPNKGRTASNALETITYDNNRRADKFFQEFETLAGRAGHRTNDAYLIDLIERKVPPAF